MRLAELVPGVRRASARLRRVAGCASRWKANRRICSCSLRQSRRLLRAYDASKHEGNYITYIMASRSPTLYIGMSRELQKRVFEHKWKEHEGFTARYDCDRLVWFERFQWVKNAIAREKVLRVGAARRS